MGAMDEKGELDARVYFAAERTMLAWVRTGIAMMGFGFVVARFGLFLREIAAMKVDHLPSDHQSGGMSLWIGTTLVVMGVWVTLTAAAQHFRFRRRFERREPFTTPRGVMAMVLSVLLALLGISMAVYLIIVGR